MTTQTLYYAQLDNETFGPFALETIFGMNLTPDVLVLSTNTNQWKQACEYPELLDSLDLSNYEIFEEESMTERDPATDKVIPSFNERSIFYIRRGGSPYGPYNLEALASVPISENSEISLDGMISWFKVYEISGLLNTLTAISNSQYSGQREEQTSEHDNNEEISNLLNRVQGLIPNKKPLFRKVFENKETEREFLISEYNRVFKSLLKLIQTLSENCHNATLNRRAILTITSTINDVVEKINRHYLSEIEKLDANKDDFTTSSVTIGKTHYSILPPLEDVNVYRLDFLTVLGEKNLCVTYDNDSIDNAIDFANSIIAKLYESNPARLIETEVVDTDFMTGLNDSFKLLNRDLYRVISRSDDVRNTLIKLQERAGTILRNILVEKDSTLQDYNSSHENKEANILLVLKNFPNGLTTDNLELIKKLSKVGPKSGIFIIILASNESLLSMGDKEKEALNIEDFKEMANFYNFAGKNNQFLNVLKSNDSNKFIEGQVQFNILTESEVKKIVKDVNAKCELKEDVIVSISDYLPDRTNWWSFQSAKQIEIPFGIGNDMHIKSLKITQESGQNTAVVIGIPGSGKSVFLHSLICSAAIKYSPDELRMYLIDFSGVEFNSYALGNLPHARVIAPEAEREFGLSILNELVEEGSRRMTLCRDYNVSNIVDLKRIAPEIKVPRLLVIIDEYQKLFEIENDIIAHQANSKIHIIIQEFRKFGINLILATQKLPAAMFLPKDLIANRVVFKSTPSDFSTLIAMVNREGMPRLRTGQCIYNSESGTPYANEIVQGFFVSKNHIDNLMAQIGDYQKTVTYEHEPVKVFRSSVLPLFVNRRIHSKHTDRKLPGQPVPVYFGESIAVSDFDVCLELSPEDNNNILIIGGEPDVAHNICFYSLMSISTSHDKEDASFIVINGMRKDLPYNKVMMEQINSLPFGHEFPSLVSEVEVTLNSIKTLIEERRNNNMINEPNIYIGIFDLQNCRAFDKDNSGRVEKPSPSSVLLEFILRNGPSVGVFTILQINSLENLSKIGSVLSAFNYRVALQMPDSSSTKVVGNSAANKLFVFNKPASKYRGLLYDNSKNMNIKFKPYKSI